MSIQVKEYDSVEQEDRFYPEEVPLFDYEPLKKHFKILKSPEPINEGIVTLVSFKEGDLVCKWTGYHLNFQTLHSLQHTEDRIFVHDPYFCGKMLHSCDSNCMLDMNSMEIIALKNINPFEKLMLDYNKTEKQLYQSFHCTCGAPDCKKFIEGYGSKE